MLGDQRFEKSSEVKKHNNNFALLFCFQSGRTVQVQSEYAELVTDPE
jgi:hypothetical protein